MHFRKEAMGSGFVRASPSPQGPAKKVDGEQNTEGHDVKGVHD